MWKKITIRASNKKNCSVKQKLMKKKLCSSSRLVLTNVTALTLSGTTAPAIRIQTYRNLPNTKGYVIRNPLYFYLKLNQ